MSWMTADAGQDSRVGTTRPTPLPERVGAKVRTCSGPSWRRYWGQGWPRKTPDGCGRAGVRRAYAVAKRAEPEGGERQNGREGGREREREEGKEAGGGGRKKKKKK